MRVTNLFNEDNIQPRATRSSPQNVKLKNKMIPIHSMAICWKMLGLSLLSAMS